VKKYIVGQCGSRFLFFIAPSGIVNAIEVYDIKQAREKQSKTGKIYKLIQVQSKRRGR